MAPKPDKLLQRISDLQKFIAERTNQNTNQDTAYQTIQQTLEQLEATLKQGKITLQLVGEASQIQALQKLLKTNPAIEPLYDFKTTALPELADLSVPSAYLLETASEPRSRYPLSTQPQLLGRHPDAQFRLPDALTLVSGRHAELRLLESAQPNQTDAHPTWQICDLNSRNGTYVNGERVQACRTLQSGDFISLGAAISTKGSAAFQFEQPHPSSRLTEDEAYKIPLDAHVLCLVVALQPSLSVSAQRFLLQSNSVSAKRIVIAAMPGEMTELIKTNLSHLAAWIDDKASSAELIPLLLHSTPTSNATVLSPQAQPEFEQFCQSLKAAVSKPERLTERITASLNQQIERIEQTLAAEAEALKQGPPIGADNKSLDALKERFQKAIGEVREDKEKVFKQIKQELSQARAGILDSFSRRSILYQIQAFTDALNPSVLREGNYRRIHLQNGSTGVDVQQQMHELCRTTLIKWSTAEWQKIHTDYAEDGLQGLQNRIQANLNQVTLAQIDWIEEAKPHFDPQRILDSSIVEPNFETRYRGDSIKDYFMKQMRAPLMQFTFLSGAVITIGTFLFWLLKSILQGATPTSTSTSTTASPSNQYFNAIPAGWKSSIAFIVVFLCISGLMYFFYSLHTNYQREEEFKREDAIAKIRKDLVNYYQSLAKSLVERLSQNLNLLLETEEQKLSKTIDRISEQLKQQVLDAKGQIENYSKQQQKLNEAKMKLEKLKES